MSNLGEASQLKREIIVRLIKAFFSDDFIENTRLIPYDMRPKGMEVPYRCCVYKERAIIKDRAIAGLGFPIEEDNERISLSTYAKKALERTETDNNNLTVLQAACKGCAPSQIFVTDLCQGCVARPCQSACKFDAISFEDGHSVIDNEKCKKCQMCVNVCPYKAITKRTIPCEDSCPVGAIHKDDTGFSTIDFDKCINCGRCISRCPFGAVHEKSQIIDILKMIKSSKKVVAMIAPSIVGQFNCTLYQLKTALIKAGFDEVVEVAQGADITATREAKEFLERMESGENFMTTSCCAGYNQLANKHLQEIKPYISDTKTPMYYTAEIVKAKDEDCISVFVTPCVAKRAEAFDNKNVDFVMNYEELNALFEAREIDYQKCEETPFEKESSKQARNFGITGGVADSVKKALKEEDKVKPCVISGINKDSIKQLKKCATTGKCADGNLIEVMCCEGGCISGNATLNNSRTAKKLIDNLLANSQDIEKI